MRRPAVRRYALWAQLSLEQRGIGTSPDALISLVLAALVTVAVLGCLIVGSPVFGAAVAGCALVVLCAAVRSDVERREAALRDEIPDALRSLGVCFKAGLSLAQTLRQTASEMKGPLGGLFLSSALVLDAGGTTSESLALFRQRTDVPELAFVAVALNVQHRSGGSLSAVLDAARQSVESEIELARSLKVQTAQAQLSARIVTAMPFVLIALFSLLSPGFLSPFFESVAGMALLGAALLMQAAGVVIVHRMLDVGGRRS
ncbi:type II secretion system F family protein [Adlercreutzia sp. R25]|uniref:type II secretion system F family protein n=1 Tax=Adlercreutzia shanghongiae TaxID=3111773 RepID=UPI002DBD3CD7|nr:type II secretion system F family protein [Adlercreutzia sp. R25]MEC4273135.1 type II secretion system F family protein [Adlercreutzia sp. R25]